MIQIEPTHYRLTIADQVHDLTAEEVQELHAALTEILSTSAATNCSEELPAFAPMPAIAPTLHGVIVPPDPTPAPPEQPE